MPVGDILPGDTLDDGTLELDRIERELDAVDSHLARQELAEQAGELDELDESDGLTMNDKTSKRVLGGVVVAGILWWLLQAKTPGAGKRGGQTPGGETSPGVYGITVDGRGYSAGMGWRTTREALMADVCRVAGAVGGMGQCDVPPGTMFVIDASDGAAGKVDALLAWLADAFPSAPVSVERD